MNENEDERPNTQTSSVCLPPYIVSSSLSLPNNKFIILGQNLYYKANPTITSSKTTLLLFVKNHKLMTKSLKNNTKFPNYLFIDQMLLFLTPAEKPLNPSKLQLKYVSNK